jgi:hypothetical protein
MKKWNDSKLQTTYEQIVKQGLNFTEYNENLFDTPTLECWKFNTKSDKQWKKIKLAYLLGQMRAIKDIDDGNNIISISETNNSNTYNI